MTYCMSDLHGEKDLFDKMLEKIHFSFQDHLYILGDVIDRGPHGVELLEQIMASDNITMLLGNHEQMCLSASGNRGPGTVASEWRDEHLSHFALPPHFQGSASDSAFSRRIAGSSGHHSEWAEIPSGPWLPRAGSGNPHLGPGG